MKKTLVILIAVLFIFTLAPSSYGEAAYGPGSAVISVSSIDNVEPGDELKNMAEEVRSGTKKDVPSSEQKSSENSNKNGFGGGMPGGGMPAGGRPF